MKALVIAAHGSRKKESALEVAALTEKLIKKVKSFDLVIHGFLQFADPPLAEVMDQVVKEGADTVVVFPFFISAGSHILTDIPELVNEFAGKYPEVDFRITRHLGSVDGIEDIILKEVGGEC